MKGLIEFPFVIGKKYSILTKSKYDGYGFFLTYVCFECEGSKMEMFVDNIMGEYEHDEELY